MPTAISRPNSTSVNCQRWTLNAQMRIRGSALLADDVDRVTLGQPRGAIGDDALARLEPGFDHDAVADDGTDRHLLAARNGAGRVEHVDSTGRAARLHQRRDGHQRARGGRPAAVADAERDFAD